MKDLLAATNIKGKIAFTFTEGGVHIDGDDIEIGSKKFIPDELNKMVLALHLEEAVARLKANAEEQMTKNVFKILDEIEEHENA